MPRRIGGHPFADEFRLRVDALRRWPIVFGVRPLGLAGEYEVGAVVDEQGPVLTRGVGQRPHRKRVDRKCASGLSSAPSTPLYAVQLTISAGQHVRERAAPPRRSVTSTSARLSRDHVFDGENPHYRPAELSGGAGDDNWRPVGFHHGVKLLIASTTRRLILGCHLVRRAAAGPACPHTSSVTGHCPPSTAEAAAHVRQMQWLVMKRREDLTRPQVIDAAPSAFERRHQQIEDVRRVVAAGRHHRAAARRRHAPTRAARARSCAQISWRRR